ncbi:MAG: hypothetical protein NTZ05_23340 [Chloroflexi bacterium]|nr:hypothetical protein [Chloroflexota bacterium]
MSTNEKQDPDAGGARFIFVPLTEQGAVASQVTAAEVEMTRNIGVRALRITPDGDVVVETRSPVRLAMAGGIAWASVGASREESRMGKVPVGRADSAVISISPPVGRSSGRRLSTASAEIVFDETVGVTNLQRRDDGELIVSIDVLPTMLDGSGGFTRVLGPLFNDREA